MDRFSNWINLLSVCSITFNTYALEIKTLETREFRSGLNRNGGLIEIAKTPKCGSEKKIYLISYSYHQLQCRLVEDCISTHEEPLLPAEEIMLHQMCSMQEECRNLTFPLRSEEQMNRTNAVLIKYQCIDLSAQANICGSSKHFNDAVYLTSVDIKGSFSECQCFVNNGRFSVDLTDIRMNSNIEKKCSPAKLYINDRQVSCDANRADYGSIFHDTFGEPIRNAYISLIQNSETVLPNMVLVTLTPEGSAKITCNGKQTTPKPILNSTSAKLRTTYILIRPNETTLADNTEGRKSNTVRTDWIIVLVMFTAINTVSCFFIMVILAKFYLKRTNACSRLNFRCIHAIRPFRLCLGEQSGTLVPTSEETKNQSSQSKLEEAEIEISKHSISGLMNKLMHDIRQVMVCLGEQSAEDINMQSIHSEDASMDKSKHTNDVEMNFV